MKIDKRRCHCWYRINIKKEDSKIVFPDCTCSKGCTFCMTNNQICGGMK